MPLNCGAGENSWESLGLQGDQKESILKEISPEYYSFVGFLDISVGKESTCNAGDPGSIPGSGRSAGKGIGYPPQVCLYFPCGSAGKESVYNVGDLGSIPRLGRSAEEGKGYPHQYSGLENSMGCIVHGVAKSRTWLNNFHFYFFHYSLEGLMLMLKLQSFGHLMWRADSLEKTLMLGKIEGRRRRGWQRTRCWMALPIQRPWVWASSRRWRRTRKPDVLQSMGYQRIGHDRATEQQQQQQIWTWTRYSGKCWTNNLSSVITSVSCI